MKKIPLSKNEECLNGEIYSDIGCVVLMDRSDIDGKVNVSRHSSELLVSHNTVNGLLNCLKKISTVIGLNFSIVNLIFAIIYHGGNIMNKKIEISKETDELIRKMGRMGETYDDIIQRGFGYLNSDSNFWNQE